MMHLNQRGHKHMVNSWTGFDQLKEVWLGDCYPVEYYNGTSSAVYDAFARITEITQTDLAEIETILKQQGVIVHRPRFTCKEDYVNEHGVLIKPPIMPRDDSMALGNNFYHLRNNYKTDPWQHQLNLIGDHAVSITPELDCLGPPSIVRVGADLYIDYDTHKHVWGMVGSTFVDWAKDYRVHIIETGGHSDGVFCPVAEGIIVASCWMEEYNHTFPNWKVFQLPQEHTVHFGKWWIDDDSITNNNAFADHINQYALDWIGDFTETQFSVNMLVVNEKTVISVNENRELNDWLDSNGINVIIAPFRAKSFWDGGLHCLTVDTIRNGTKRDFFPHRRTKHYLDWQ